MRHSVPSKDGAAVAEQLKTHSVAYRVIFLENGEHAGVGHFGVALVSDPARASSNEKLAGPLHRGRNVARARTSAPSRPAREGSDRLDPAHSWLRLGRASAPLYGNALTFAQPVRPRSSVPWKRPAAPRRGPVADAARAASAESMPIDILLFREKSGGAPRAALRPRPCPLAPADGRVGDKATWRACASRRRRAARRRRPWTRLWPSMSSGARTFTLGSSSRWAHRRASATSVRLNTTSQSAANNLSKQFGERKKKGESLDDLQVEIAKVKEEIAKAEAKKDASEVCCAASRLSFASLLLSLTRRQCG